MTPRRDWFWGVLITLAGWGFVTVALLVRF